MASSSSQPLMVHPASTDDIVMISEMKAKAKPVNAVAGSQSLPAEALLAREGLVVPDVKGEGFKIFSWNVNGLRTIDIKKSLSELNATILAIQETKLTRRQLTEAQAIVDGYSSYFSYSKNRSGYSGVATYCRNEISPMRAEEGISGLFINKTAVPKESSPCIGGYCDVQEGDIKNSKYLDNDGRIVITQHMVMTTMPSKHKILNVINVYAPRLRCDPTDTVNNTELKMTFHRNLTERARNLVKAGQFVLIVGDLNVCHKRIDQAEVDAEKDFERTEFREWLDDLLRHPTDPIGFMDTFRAIHPDEERAYTCWNTRLNARQNNYGARIDYILADNWLMNYIARADYHPNIMGSDHCPISATFHSLVLHKCTSPLPLCTKSYPEFTGKQLTLLDAFKITKEGTSNLATGGISPKVPNAPGTPKSNGNSKASSKSARKSSVTPPKGSVKQTDLRNFFAKRPRLDLPSSSSPQSVAESSTGSQTSSVPVPSTPSDFVKEINAGASQEWRKLLTTPPTPKCSGHDELCVLRTVQKKGPTQGCQFWSCPRGVGKKDNPNASCDFFQWVKPRNK